MFANLCTLAVAGALFGALCATAERRLDRRISARALEVPGAALAVLIYGWLVVAGVHGLLMQQGGGTPAGTVSGLVRDAILLLWTFTVLLLSRGAGFLVRLFPRDKRELALHSVLAVLGYVPVRLAVVATYNCTLIVADWLGYTGPMGHPTLQVIAETEDAYRRWLLIASVTLVTPLLEEALFRVALLGWLSKHVSLPVAVLGSSLIFGLFHWPPVTQPAMVVMGIMVAWAYVRTGSVYVPILIHVAFNLHSIMEVLLG